MKPHNQFFQRLAPVFAIIDYFTHIITLIAIFLFFITRSLTYLIFFILPIKRLKLHSYELAVYIRSYFFHTFHAEKPRINANLHKNSKYPSIIASFGDHFFQLCTCVFFVSML